MCWHDPSKPTSCASATCIPLMARSFRFTTCGPSGRLPSVVAGGSAQRDPADPRHARLECKALKGADFYVVRLGIRGDRSSMAAPFLNWLSGVSGTERIAIPAGYCLFER
jgi:hypothetical protein